MTDHESQLLDDDADRSAPTEAPELRIVSGQSTAASAGDEDEAYMSAVLDDGPPPGAETPKAHAKPVPRLRLPVLPEDFWRARERLAWIRQAARSRQKGPDAVLHGTLARVSSMLPYSVRADVGQGPAQLNYFVAMLAASGIGKSTASEIPAELIPIPAHLAVQTADGHDPYLDGVPIGSGEGLAERLIDLVRVKAPASDNKPRTITVRRQVRHRLLVYVDEGAQLTAVCQRQGSTSGEALRSAWAGQTFGSGNGGAHTYRRIPGGSYAIGMVIGYQMGTAQALLSDIDTGMVQRFNFAAGIDPTASLEVPAWPGALPDIWHPEELRELRFGSVIVDFPESVRMQLRRHRVSVLRGEAVDDPSDSHWPLLRIRSAALLAILDGRLTVTEEDWQLSEVLWWTSRAVRIAVAEYGRRETAAQREIVARAELDLAERKAAAGAVADAKLERLAIVLARHVVDAGGMTNGYARRTMSGRDKPLYPSVVEKAAALGLITVSDSGLLPPAVSQ